MGYSRISNLQIREHFLAHQREENLKQFKKDRSQAVLRIKRQHVWGGLSYEVYKKQSLDLLNNETLDIITNQNLTRDTTALWHTKGSSVKAALRMGQLNPQALTSKAIKALGKYYKKCADREIKSRIFSVLKDEKNTLVNMTQDRIECLQELERHLGCRIYPDTAEIAAREMISDLDNYIKKQVLSEADEQTKADNLTQRKHYRKWSWKRKFHDVRIQSLEENNQANINAATELKALIEKNKTKAEWLQTTGNKEILSFLKARILSVSRQAQGLNQVLTHQHGSGAYLRGDLNSYLEDTVKVVRDHVQDLHNPVTVDHQLAYDDNQKVTLDSDFHSDGSSEELEELMLAISVISGNNQSLVDLHLKAKAVPTSATKWRHFRSFYDANKPYELSIFSSGKHFKGLLRNILLSPLNLLETTFRGNDANIIARLRYTPPENDELVRDKTDYYALNYRIKKQTSISTKIGLELYKSFNYLLVEGLWKGLHDGWKQIKRLPEDLITDFQSQEEKPAALLSELKKELRQIQKQENEILGCDVVLMSVFQGQNIEEQVAQFRAHFPEQSGAPLIIKQGNKFSIYGYLNGEWRLTHLNDGNNIFGQLIFGEEAKLIKKGDSLLTPSINLALKRGHDLDCPPQPQRAEEAEEEKQEEVYYAQPDISLQPYASHGILNGGVTGFNEFVDLFGHNMFAKHPFTATVSTGGAAISFLAFFATPLAVKLLGKAYVKFLQDQGYIWTKDLFSASMAGSFTNFKLIGAVIEGLEHGPDSWLSRGLSHFLNDPAKAVTYTTLAWAIGYSLVYLVNIPGLSEELKKHIGDPPQLSEIFGGAKLGIIAYHLFSSPHEGSTEAARRNYLDECFQNYLDSEKKRGRVVSAEKQEEVRACLEKLISVQAVARLRAQVQEAQALPKTAREEELALMLQLSLNKEKLAQLSPLLKAKLQHTVESLATSKEDARAIEKYIDPEKHAPKSTLRSFLGRTISYAPTVIRCVLSPIAGLVTRSSVSALRPWKELGEMILDDITSTAHAISRFANKMLETLFNRIPRTLADIFINGMLARTLSFFGFHKFAMAGYQVSAAADIKQEKLYADTTGRVLNYLARKNTAPNPEVSLKYVLNERMQASFSIEPPSSIAQVTVQQVSADLEHSERSCLSLCRP